MTEPKDKKCVPIRISRFSEVIKRGDRIVEELVRKGVLKVVSMTEVCITEHTNLLTEPSIEQVAQKEMTEIWPLLLQSLNTCRNCSHASVQVGPVRGIKCRKKENGSLIPSIDSSCKYFERKGISSDTRASL
jgi:hypothetical protein